MSIVSDIREALVANISGALPDLQVLKYLVGSPTPPYVWVYPDEITFSDSVGTDLRPFIVEAIVGTISSEAAQMMLDELMSYGENSLQAAIESDPTLGGIGVAIDTQTCSGYRFFNRGGADYLGAQWKVFISAPNED